MIDTIKVLKLLSKVLISGNLNSSNSLQLPPCWLNYGCSKIVILECVNYKNFLYKVENTIN